MIQRLLSFDVSSWFGEKNNTKYIFTELDSAVEQVKERRNNTELLQKVESYLGGDVPEYFNQEFPVFYLSRHLATPNLELQHCIEMTSKYDLPLLVGEDTRGLFLSQNTLKNALAKLPVIKGKSATGDDIVEHFTIVDFNANQKKPFTEVETKFGESLAQFHDDLITSIPEISSKIATFDEADWLDNHHREDIFKQYCEIFALMCAHGVMLESFTPEETTFFESVVLPAFKEIEKEIGVKPLIVEHIPQDLEITRNWNSYPEITYPYIKSKIDSLK